MLEQATIGHALADRMDHRALFRFGYADALYVRIGHWRCRDGAHLEAETGTSLLDVTGQLTFGAGSDAVAVALAAADAPSQRLSAVDVVAAFPMFVGHGPALYEPGSGAIRGRRHPRRVAHCRGL